MQRHHFYIAHHAIKVANAIATYQAKYVIVDIDMGQGFTIYS
jgi:hypothetical protein